MYLSKLIVDVRNHAVRRDLADCQAMHRRILSAFGREAGGEARATFGALYRIEMDARTGATTVLVQSEAQPEWSRLPERYLHEADGWENPACKFTGDKFEVLQLGTRLHFRLRANPTRKIDTKTGADGARRNGKRVELRDEAEQLAWLERKGMQHGFRLRSVRAIDENKSVGRRASSQTSGGSVPLVDNAEGRQMRPTRLTFASVLFEGELVVTDKDLFHAALKQGIGTGKAYGFGLLSIASATSRE